MTLKINNCRASKLDGNIVPRHSWLILSIQITNLEPPWLRYRSLTLVIVVSALPKSVFVIQRMFVSIPSTIANIKTAHKGYFLINNSTLLMMRP